MTKVQYFTACTLDGFIADEDNSLDWLFESPHDGDDTSWDEFIGPVGALVMGATTYEWMVDHDEMLDHPEKYAEYYGDRPTWVFTNHDLAPIPGAPLTFVSGDVGPVYDDIVGAHPEANIWLVGGGDLVGQFDDAGLLDEVWLGMRPVFLGAGAPLLPRRITSKRLKIREVRHTGQQLRLILDVSHPH